LTSYLAISFVDPIHWIAACVQLFSTSRKAINPLKEISTLRRLIGSRITSGTLLVKHNVWIEQTGSKLRWIDVQEAVKPVFELSLDVVYIRQSENEYSASSQ